MEYPRLRPVEAFLVESEGKSFVGMRDPEGVSEATVMMSPAAFFIASMLDGKNDSLQMKIKFSHSFSGHVLTESEIGEVVKRLDSYGLLDTPTYRLMRADVRRRFAELRVRPASHAGAAYPGEPDELAAMIKGFFAADGGPGLIVAASPGDPPRGLVAPHIDFERGGRVYAWAHRRLLDGGLPSLIVILGVAHTAPPEPFALTRKAFDTPLGAVETDQDAADEMAAACGDWVTEDEFAHKLEHSIEFQAVWLKTMHPQSNARILPVLCSDFAMFCGDGNPLDDERVSCGLQALRRIVTGRGALVLASVDFAHVGPQFGDPAAAVDAATGDRVRGCDEDLLRHALVGDADAFWAAGMKDLNARHVDALSAVYSLLSILSPVKGEMLSYGQAAAPSPAGADGAAAGGLVSFAALSFT